MFKRSLAILLLISLTAASFQRYFVYAGFELNKAYIAKNLCENRNKPWMHCNGHCYFMRKLKAAAESEKKQAEKDNLSRLEISFFQHPASTLIVSPLMAETPIAELPEYQSFYSFSFHTSLLQPPRLAC